MPGAWNKPGYETSAGGMGMAKPPPSPASDNPPYVPPKPSGQPILAAGTYVPGVGYADGNGNFVPDPNMGGQFGLYQGPSAPPSPYQEPPKGGMIPDPLTGFGGAVPEGAESFAGPLSGPPPGPGAAVTDPSGSSLLAALLGVGGPPGVRSGAGGGGGGGDDEKRKRNQLMQALGI